MTELSRGIGDKPYIVDVSEVESMDIDEEEDVMIADVIFNHIKKNAQEYTIIIAGGISAKGGVVA